MGGFTTPGSGGGSPLSAQIICFVTDIEHLLVGNSIQFGLAVSSLHPIISYDWDWDDGSPHSTIAQPSHSYGVAGNYTISVTVTDDHANSVTAYFDLAILTKVPGTIEQGPTHIATPVDIFTQPVYMGNSLGDINASKTIMIRNDMPVDIFTEAITVTN